MASDHQLDHLVKRLRQSHSCAPPLPQTEPLLQQFEDTQGFGLPADLKEFYRRRGEAELFDGVYRIMPLTELTRASLALAGEDTEDWCPSSWYVFCDMRDGDYAGIDLASIDGVTARILDCDHEQIGRCEIIATSFTEFLGRALDSSGSSYWLGNDFEGYGTIEYEHPPSFYQRMYADWWNSLGPEIGPERCTDPSCTRLRIASSVKCRRHHYEMLKRCPCPFED
jgi:hypothetical protein